MPRSNHQEPDARTSEDELIAGDLFDPEDRAFDSPEERIGPEDEEDIEVDRTERVASRPDDEADEEELAEEYIEELDLDAMERGDGPDA
jgi:hypothetical protein